MLADDIIQSVNGTLIANLSWLTNAYGKVQRLKEIAPDNSIVTYPGIFYDDGTKDTLKLLPDEKLGNYCYWEVLDNQNYEVVNRTVKSKFSFKLVFWFHWPDLYPADWKQRSIEEVKAQILNVLVNAFYTRMITTYTVHEQAERIFSGYTAYRNETEYKTNDPQRQYLMRPYGGLAFEGDVIGTAACSLDLPMPSIPANIMGLIPFVHSYMEQVYPFEMELSSERLYVRSFDLGSGNNDYKTLTGLNDSDVGTITKCEYRALNTVNGIMETGTTQVVPNGSGGFHVFTPDFWTNIIARPYYTK